MPSQRRCCTSTSKPCSKRSSTGRRHWVPVCLAEEVAERARVETGQTRTAALGAALELARADAMAAEQRAGELGAELLGFYHSHPDHPARPSQYDLDHAWPNFAYVIVSVAAGAAGDMTVWWLKDDRTTFEKGNLHGDENSDSDTTSAIHR